MVETPNQPGANAGTTTQAGHAADIKSGWDAAFGLSGATPEVPAAVPTGAEQPSAADIKAGWDAALTSAIADRAGRP